MTNAPLSSNAPVLLCPGSDPVTQIYKNAEALRQVGEGLPEEQGGLAHMLFLIAEDIRCHCSQIDDEGGGR